MHPYVRNTFDDRPEIVTHSEKSTTRNLQSWNQASRRPIEIADDAKVCYLCEPSYMELVEAEPAGFSCSNVHETQTARLQRPIVVDAVEKIKKINSLADCEEIGGNHLGFLDKGGRGGTQTRFCREIAAETRVHGYGSAMFCSKYRIEFGNDCCVPLGDSCSLCEQSATIPVSQWGETAALANQFQVLPMESGGFNCLADNGQNLAQNGHYKQDVLSLQQKTQFLRDVNYDIGETTNLVRFTEFNIDPPVMHDKYFELDSGDSGAQNTPKYLKSLILIVETSIWRSFLRWNLRTVLTSLSAKVPHDVVAKQSSHLVKKNHVIITMDKVKNDGDMMGYDTWHDLHGRRKREDEKAKDGGKKKNDPTQSLMGMMRDMYEDGDGTTRKLIGEAMQKAYQPGGPKMGDMDNFGGMGDYTGKGMDDLDF